METDMANEMPSSTEYTGLTRTVLQYSEAFADIVRKSKTGTLTEADWAPLERIVDVAAYERVGVFATAKAEVIGWEKYKGYIAQFASDDTWEGTLRNVTEANGRVILELEERTGGSRDTVANTVTIYEFNAAGQVRHLEVYVMQLV
jgi:hypothetical protein